MDIFGSHYSVTKLCIFNWMSKRQPTDGMFKVNFNSSLHPQLSTSQLTAPSSFLLFRSQIQNHLSLLSHISHISHKEIHFVFKIDLESDHFSSSLLPLV